MNRNISEKTKQKYLLKCPNQLSVGKEQYCKVTNEHLDKTMLNALGHCINIQECEYKESDGDIYMISQRLAAEIEGFKAELTEKIKKPNGEIVTGAEMYLEKLGKLGFRRLVFEKVGDAGIFSNEFLTDLFGKEWYLANVVISEAELQAEKEREREDA